MKDGLTNDMMKVDYICTTADIWSCNNKSFFGVTGHWVDPVTLERRSAALACRRVTGRHTYNVIAEALNSVHVQYRIGSKVIVTVTDNAANFVKAFREFMSDDTASGLADRTTSTRDDVEDDSDNLTFTDVSGIISEGDDENEISLPQHQRCAAHTLNLVATNDTEVANGDAHYKKISRTTLGKCQALWNKASRSTSFADIVREKLHTCLVVPNATRWNSFFNAVDKIRDVLDKTPDDAIAQVFHALDVAVFSANHIIFIKEYCSVMQPLATALDILQGDKNLYIGYLLPTLVSLQNRLQAVKPGLKYAGPLADAVLAGISQRFLGYFERTDLIVASVTLPQFKLRWLDDAGKEHARSLLYSHACNAQDSSRNAREPDGESPDEDFFSFPIERESRSTNAEVDMFLTDTSRDLDSLKKFPLILKLFLRFNIPLPSSASVERLFSLGSQIYLPRRNRLSDSNFERQLLMRANKFWITE